MSLIKSSCLDMARQILLKGAFQIAEYGLLICNVALSLLLKNGEQKRKSAVES